MAHNPYQHGYSAGQAGTRMPGNGGGNGGPGGGDPFGGNGRGCGLPAPNPAGSPECAEEMGGRYCRSHLGNVAALAAGGSGVITLTPRNATEYVARWLHMTATSQAPVSPVVFTQAFTITAITILGDNQLADSTPVIGSTWAAQQTYLEVFWTRVITATNPLTINVTNLDTVLGIDAYASVAGDFVKS